VASADDLRHDARQALATIRTEVARIRVALSGIERGLDELEATSSAPTAPARRHSERHLRVLIDVYERGGRHGVGPEEWVAIGRRHGYERRGLGGFFTGANASLRQLDGRVVLTPYGEQLVDGYLAGLR
jgi:hypothetical protein